MAIKVQWEAGGPFAICDTPAEAAELLKYARSSTNGDSGQRQKHEPARDVAVPQSIEERLRETLRGVNEKAKEILGVLMESPNGIEGEEFAKLCGTPSRAFGGVFGALSKSAKKQGLTLDDVVLSEARFEGSRRYRWLAPSKLLREHWHHIR